MDVPTSLPVDLSRAQDLVVQLEALMLHTCAASGDAFQELPESARDAYLWSVYERVTDLARAIGVSVPAT